jgi:very-short-patch-repair endonuclease
MKKINLENFNWEELQKKHDEGVVLSKLGVSPKVIDAAVKSGVFVKRKITRKLSSEVKKNISEKRKEWLRNNPDKHPWRNKDKFKSVPCEYLKTKLRDAGISFDEEVIISNEKNYSVDILIPSKNLIIEVNGNQHYDRLGKLLPYYKKRHDHIVSLGWNVIELHYSSVYNHKLVIEMINNNEYASNILPVYIKEKKDKRKYGGIEEYVKNRKEDWVKKNMQYVETLKNSGIDFSKFGWVTEAAKLINQPVQKVKIWMERMMPEFYAEKCFKRNPIKNIEI